MLSGFVLSANVYTGVEQGWDEVCVVISVEVVDGIKSVEVKTWLKSVLIMNSDLTNLSWAEFLVFDNFIWPEDFIVFCFDSAETGHVDEWGEKKWGDTDRSVLSCIGNAYSDFTGLALVIIDVDEVLLIVNVFDDELNEDFVWIWAADTIKQPFVGPLSFLLIEIEKFRSSLGSPSKNLSSALGHLKIDVKWGVSLV